MTSYPDIWMWARACELIYRAERLNRQFCQPAPAGGRSPRWEPPVDVVETDEAMWVTVALPGVAGEDIGVGIEGDHLLVSGRRRLPSEFRRALVHRLELPFGRFERRIPLPARPTTVAQQELADGCLTIVLRKAR